MKVTLCLEHARLSARPAHSAPRCTRDATNASTHQFSAHLMRVVAVQAARERNQELVAAERDGDRAAVHVPQRRVAPHVHARGVPASAVARQCNMMAQNRRSRAQRYSNGGGTAELKRHCRVGMARQVDSSVPSEALSAGVTTDFAREVSWPHPARQATTLPADPPHLLRPQHPLQPAHRADLPPKMAWSRTTRWTGVPLKVSLAPSEHLHARLIFLLPRALRPATPDQALLLSPLSIGQQRWPARAAAPRPGSLPLPCPEASTPQGSHHHRHHGVQRRGPRWPAQPSSAGPARPLLAHRPARHPARLLRKWATATGATSSNSSITMRPACA